MRCPVCLSELQIGGSLAKDYGYCPKCQKWRKQKDAIVEGQELTIEQRLAVLEAKVKELEAKVRDERSGG